MSSSTEKRKWAATLKDQEAVATIAKALVGLILFAISLYGDIMFIQVMARVFPEGFGKVLAIMGAVSTGASVLIGLVSEFYWFSRGKQQRIGWGFIGVEVCVSVANAILAYQMGNGAVDSWLGSWQQLCAATPFISLIGWIVILSVDENNEIRHTQREMETDKKLAALQYEQDMHDAQMDLDNAYLEHQKTYLQQEVDSPENHAMLREAARRKAKASLSRLAGMPITANTALPTGDSDMVITDRKTLEYLYQQAGLTSGQSPTTGPVHVPLAIDTSNGNGKAKRGNA